HCGRLPNVPGAAQTRGDTGHMNEYEMVLLVHQDVSKDDRTKILDKARDTIKSGGGTWVEDADWGRRELAYDIDHQRHAHYFFAKFDGEPATVDELLRVMRITEGVVRIMAFDRIDDAAAEATAQVEVKRGRGRDRDRD